MNKTQAGELLVEEIKNNSIPPIKGDITYGKIKWRGLTANRKATDKFGTYEYWYEQRGKRITSIVLIENI